MFDPQRPAPCALASYPMYILIEAINEAIAQARHESMPGGFDMCVSLVMWGSDAQGSFWADSINVVGGAPAAAAYGDGGGPLMPVGISGLRGMSWEVWEAKTPMVVEQADFAPDSAGAGRSRGGPGIDFAVTCLSIKEGLVHATKNLTTPDPDCDLDYVPNAPRKVAIQHALSNSTGMVGPKRSRCWTCSNGWRRASRLRASSCGSPMQRPSSVPRTTCAPISRRVI